jgi:hypothetical protein
LNQRGLVVDLIKLFLRNSRVLAAFEHLLRLRTPDNKFWTWEVYALGAALRRVLNLGWGPRLSVGSDHGINLGTEPGDSDQKLETDIHVTWSLWRAKMEFHDARLVLRAQHPWVPYRKIKGYSLSPQARGTIVFVPHSVPGLDYEEFNIEDFLATLKSLPEKFHPLTLCLQFHDASIEAVIKIAKAGYRSVTAGNSLSPSYADRFYSIIRTHQYATSPSIGSQLFYCHELGVRYFLFDPQKKFQRRLNPTKGVPLPNQEITERIKEAFDIGNIDTHERERDSMVNEGLGLDLDSLDNFGYDLLLKSIKRKNRD